MSTVIHLAIDEILFDGMTPPATLREELLGELQTLLLEPQALAILQASEKQRVARIDGGRLGTHSAVGRQLAFVIARSLLGPSDDSQREQTSHSMTAWESDSVRKEHP